MTGTKQLLDLVNIVYTDARGYPQTEFNVSLPWSKVIVLNPGVQTQSVIATSIYGRLNCSILNAAGSDGGGVGQQHDHGDLHPLTGQDVGFRQSAQTEFVHPSVVGLLQPLEERTELAQATGPGYHQVDQLIVIGQQILGLGDRFAEQTTRPQRQPAALFAAGGHSRAHLGDDELGVPGLRQGRPHYVGDLVGQPIGDFQI